MAAESMGYIPPQEEYKGINKQPVPIPESKITEEPINTKIDQELSAHGYKLDTTIAPYKSFGPGERFFIAKSYNDQNQESVVKIAADEVARKTLEREGHLYDVLQRAISETQASGVTVGINFPRKTDQFELGEQDHRLVIVSNFVKDDKQLKESLSQEQKIALITYVVQEMNKLVVPQEEVQKNWQERSFNIETAEEINWRGKHILENFKEGGQLSPADADGLMDYFDRLDPALQSYPLKFDHGDLHGGNIAYSVNSENNQPNIVIMDLESLKVSNEFSSIAQLINRETIKQNLGRYDSKLAVTPRYKEQIVEAMGLIPDGITPYLKATFVKNETDRQVLQLMQVFEVITGLDNLIQQGVPESDMKREVYQGLLAEQLETLRQEGILKS